MRAVFQLPASMTSVVDAPRAVSSDASPTRPLCAVTRASMPAARAAAVVVVVAVSIHGWGLGALLEAAAVVVVVAVSIHGWGLGALLEAAVAVDLAAAADLERDVGLS